MTAVTYTLLAAYALGSVMAFGLMGLDKWKARRGAYRVPERALLLWCACLGAFGGYLGMRAFRHKTNKPKFAVGVPLLMMAQFLALAIYFRNTIANYPQNRPL